MADSEAKKQWMKENTVFIGLKLNKNTDSDILSALGECSKQGEIKRLIRLALQYEQAGECSPVFLFCRRPPPGGAKRRAASGMRPCPQ